MRRREFIGLLGCAAGWPLVARAQQPAMPVIGYLGAETSERFATRLTAFRQGLNEMGYDDGRNVKIEFRWANGQSSRLAELADQLVRQRVTVIATPGSGVAALAAKGATKAIPIVFETGLDPISVGLVTSLSRPEGNITGVTSLNVDLLPKGLELLRELIPQSKAFAVLVNPANRVNFEIVTKGLEAASRTFGLQLHYLNVSSEPEAEAAFTKLAELRVAGLMISGDPFFNSRSQLFAALTLKHAVPAVHTVREFAIAGGLMSYGGSIKESHRLAGVYTARILKGEKPADLPVQRATKIELAINLKTAKALGLNVPNTLVGRADEVIE
jgi:putative tryptophan/tyrosine transport system substrate-binding protein